MQISAIVPAHNEEGRIAAVLEAIVASGAVEEVIAVSDGSTDGTYEIARSHPKVKAVRLEQNVGKGGAMLAGARCAACEGLAFFDADLIGLRPSHVRDLTFPVREGLADMAIGVFRGGWWLTDWSQRLVPYISGQRSLKRDFFLSVPALEHARYGVEVAIGRHARAHRLRIANVVLEGVTHTIKEEKLGLLRGIIARSRMYADIARLMMDGRR